MKYFKVHVQKSGTALKYKEFKLITKYKEFKHVFVNIIQLLRGRQYTIDIIQIGKYVGITQPELNSFKK